MANRDCALAAFEELRRLAAESPREARGRLASLLDSGDPVLGDVLHLASALGEGRLRQIIANAVKNRPDKERVVPHLVRWLELETDEFARAAISGALIEEERVIYHQPGAAPDPPRLVDTYRYVADRLCHRVRNSLTGPSRHLRRLESVLNGGADPIAAEAKAVVSQLKDAFAALSRIVEFDTGDSYFQWRSVDLPAWIKTMNAKYVAKNSSLGLSIIGYSGSIRVRANDYLLETLFWNLWKNAQQAIGPSCEIRVQLEVVSAHVRLLVADNGRGFSAEDAEVAFIDQFERRGANYGRGLLEVQDAVRRLSGSVGLAQVTPGEYRVQITLPVAIS
jgi:signal transduction histidine kinase